MKKTEIAAFGGGCFWCMVQPFENTEGVTQVTSGYAGGTGDNPPIKIMLKRDRLKLFKYLLIPSA